jgi:hypothetical protein
MVASAESRSLRDDNQKSNSNSNDYVRSYVRMMRKMWAVVSGLRAT